MTAEEVAVAAVEGAAVEVADGGEAKGDVAPDEVPGLSEACRRFPMPDKEAAAHALRELSWGEQFVASRVVPSKGGSDMYLYSLHSAAVFLLSGDQAHIGKGADQMLLLIDVDRFIDWVEQVVGDVDLACALREECDPADPYRDRLAAVQRLLDLRMVQYGVVAS